MKILKIYLLLFFYIFNISFVFLPIFISTRTIIGIFGVLYFVLVKEKFGSSQLKIVNSILLILIPSILTMVINQYIEPRFYGYVIQNILWFFGAYYIVKINKLSELNIIKAVVVTIVIHNALAVVMFLIPTLSSFIVNLQHLGDTKILTDIGEFRSRLIGIGWGNFFFGGVIGSVALLLNAYIIVKFKNKVFWILIYLFLCITSIYIARIAYFGVLFSILYLLFVTYKNNIKLFIKLIFWITVLIISFSVYIYYNINSLLEVSSFKHSFEIFINYFNEGNFSSSSTEGVIEMFIFPKEFKGVLFGDGIFNLEGGSYYMGTDVGYSRLAYYFGFPGIIIYFITSFVLFMWLKRNTADPLKLYLFKSLILLLIVSNFKGLVDLNWLFFLLFWTSYLFSKNESITCN